MSRLDLGPRGSWRVMCTMLNDDVHGGAYAAYDDYDDDGDDEAALSAGEPSAQDASLWLWPS